MKKIGIIMVMVPALVATSCGDKQRIERLEAERDSILTEHLQLSEFLGTVSQSMDSIAMQEGDIFKMNNVEGTPVPTKEQIKENLNLFEELLNRQRARIAFLEDSLKNATDSRATKLMSIVRGLRAQVEEKDKMIAQLRGELKNKNADIVKLKSHVSALSENVMALNEQTQEQEAALTAQSDMMNEGYVKAGTKKELQKLGLLSGSGLFAKKKLDVSNLNTDYFEKIDMRTFQELRIEGKNPKILTPIPESSYQIDKNDDGTCTLKVLDPTLFWSVSNFLVIQYK